MYLPLWLGQAAKHSLPSCGGCLYLLYRHVVRRLCWDDRRHRTPVDCPKADELSGKILQQAMPQGLAPCMRRWQCVAGDPRLAPSSPPQCWLQACHPWGQQNASPGHPA